MSVLPHWMFMIDNLIRAAVKRTIDDISKGMYSLLVLQYNLEKRVSD